MKKLAKPLILLLVISLLAGAFVFSALAEDTSTSTGAVVGSYTQPEKSWKTEDTTVVFATWATEQDFLDGKDPVDTYKDGAVLEQDNVGATVNGTVGYVHLFKNASVNSTTRPYTANNQTLVINLGGNALTADLGFRVGNDSVSVCTASLTIKNGTFNQKSQFQTRINTTTIFDNVVYNANGGTLSYDAGCQLMEYRNCTINLANGVFWDLTIPNKTNTDGEYIAPHINFVNTDLIQGTATMPLFRIKTAIGTDVNGSAVITFDKDSSLTRAGTVPIVRLNSAMTVNQYKDASAENPTLVDPADVDYPVFKNTQYLYFEAGCVVSKALAPTTPYAYQYDYYNGSENMTAVQVYGEGAKSLETKTSRGADDKGLVVGVLKDNAILDNWMTADAGNGMVQLIKTPSAENAWTPTKEGNTEDYTGIVYGVWVSEIDYLRGIEPEDWYKDGELNAARVGTETTGATYTVDYTPGYIHAYGDLEIKGTQLVTGQTQNLTINLNKNTLQASEGIRVGGSSASHPEAALTVKNGTWNMTYGQLQLRGDTTFICEKVNFNSTSANFLYGTCADYVRFTDCNITSGGNRLQFSSHSASAGLARSVMIFENTKLEFTATPTQEFFYFAANSTFDISFDKDSSVIGDLGNWYLADAITAAGGVTFTFEDGFTLTEDTALPVSNTAGTVVVKSGTVNYICSEHTAGGEVKSDVVEATCTAGGSYKSTVTCTECGTVISSSVVETPAKGHTFGKNEKGEDIACTVCSAAPYQPAAGTTYVVWATELDYLTGKAPVDVYSDATITEAAIGTTDAYVHVYANVSITATETKILGPNQNLVINLAGKTLTQTGKIRVGNDSVSSYPNVWFTIKNGTWTRTGGQLQLRKDVNVIIENVVFNNSKGDLFTSGWAANLIKFKDCTINAAADNFKNTDTSNGADTVRSKFILENTDVIFSGANTAAFFNFNHVDTMFDFYFDGNSSIQGNVYAWYSSTVELPEGAVTFTFEDGFTLTQGTTLPEKATGVTVTAGKINYICVEHTAGDAVISDEKDATCTTSGSYKSTVTCTACGTVISSEVIVTSPAKGHTFGKDENGDIVCTVCGEPAYQPAEGTTYVVWASELDYLLGNDPYLVSTDAEITGNADNNNILDYIPNGAIIILYDNVDMGAVHTYSNYSLTIDLNGYTLTLTTSTNMQLGYDMSGSWKERVITFKSSNDRGTLDATARTVNTFQARPGSIVLFENLDITIGGSLFNDGGAKSITMKNCTLTGKGNFANTSGLGSAVPAGETRTYTFDNTAIYGMTVVYNYPAVLDNLTINFTNGCILDNARADMFKFANNAGTKVINFSKDTKFTNFNLDALITTDGKANITLKFLDGETAVTNYAVWSSGEYYVIGAKTTVTGFSANLTLFSDFNLNFFATEGITGVYYNGKLLDSMEWDSKVKYTLTGITPDTAAETLNFLVAVQVDNETCYMPLSYSVLKYAQTVVGDGTTVNNGTKLVTAVMDYVKAAYAYKGYDVPEFKGVAYDTQTVSNASAFSHAAISGVALKLDTGVGVHFNLDSDYTGTLTVGDATYSIVNGKLDGTEVDYVVVNMRAYEFYNKGIVVADTVNGTATYTLANYVAWANGTNDANLKTLVNALYNYSYYAAAYKAEQN